MRQILFLSVTLAAASGCAWAQPGPPGGRAGPGGGPVAGPGAGQVTVDPKVQRQIREVLQINRPAAGVMEPDPIPTADRQPTPPYQLTPEGKAQMREQLRRDRDPNESRRGTAR